MNQNPKGIFMVVKIHILSEISCLDQIPVMGQFVRLSLRVRSGNRPETDPAGTRKMGLGMDKVRPE